MIYLLLACSLFGFIQDNYYNERSLEVATIDVSETCLEGREKQISLNRIARANYKHENYKKAYRLANTIQYNGYDKLKWDTISLKALLAMNIGNFSEADSLYQTVLHADINYDFILYTTHYNYAKLYRLQMNYDDRRYHLLQSLSYSDGRERNKVIRTLARHYFNVLLEFDNAKKMLNQHDPYDSLTDEGKAGYLLVQAQYAEALQNYEKAKQYYKKAQRVAKKAGFISFQLTAVDGSMKSEMLLKEKNKNDRHFMYVNIAILVVVVVLFGWKELIRRRNAV